MDKGRGKTLIHKMWIKPCFFNPSLTRPPTVRTTTKLLSMFSIAVGRASGWARVRQITEVPQNLVNRLPLGCLGLYNAYDVSDRIHQVICESAR